MARYRLLLEYDGTGFCGWQSQAQGCGVQDHLERAIFALLGETTTCYGAGRTDTGVHASGQVVHCDLAKGMDGARLVAGLNFHLRGAPVAVLASEPVGGDFDARFSARRRHYVYTILTRLAPPILQANRAWHVPQDLDIGAMQDAAQVLVGHHDFTTFRAAQCQARTPSKTLERLEVQATQQDGDARVYVRAAARSFLQHQVRSMVGALKYVGVGKWDAPALRHALEARAREQCPPLAPAYGLCLYQVDYDAGGDGGGGDAK